MELFQLQSWNILWKNIYKIHSKDNQFNNIYNSDIHPSDILLHTLVGINE